MDNQTIRCSVTIDRVAPWAKDASVSTKGYERGARFYSSDTTANEVDAWIAANAPEIDPNGTRQPVFTRGEAFTYPDRTGTIYTAYENRDYYFLNGRDPRGWRTEVYVQFTYPEIVEGTEVTQEPAATSSPTLTIVPAIVEREYVDLEFVTTTEYDDDPDTSWLEQTDDQMGDGYEEHAQERIDAYNRGDWHMIGVVVEATLTDDEGRTEEFRQSVWGIESDADQSSINEVAQDLTRELVSDLERFGLGYEWIAQFSDVIAGDRAAQRGEVLALAAD